MPILAALGARTGFLGMSGEQVTPEESRFVDELSVALNEGA